LVLHLPAMPIGVLVVMASLLTITHATASTPPKPIPDVAYQQLNGSSVTVSDLRGTVVLLNFWGTWCGPCLQEIPHLVRLSHKLKTKGLEVVGIALDSGHPDDIRAFMAELGMNYTVWQGDLALVKQRFQVMGFPTSLLIDRMGLVHKRYFGPQTEEVFTRDAEPLLQ